MGLGLGLVMSIRQRCTLRELEGDPKPKPNSNPNSNPNPNPDLGKLGNGAMRTQGIGTVIRTDLIQRRLSCEGENVREKM